MWLGMVPGINACIFAWNLSGHFAWNLCDDSSLESVWGNLAGARLASSPGFGLGSFAWNRSGDFAWDLCADVFGIYLSG